MKKERKVVRHDYSKCPDSPKRDKEYYGIFKKKDGYVHIDTKRFKKTLKELGATEFWHDGMAANRSTPYLIPSRMKRHDYYVNIFRDSLEGLSREWREEFLPAIKTLRTPKEVEDGARLAALSTRSGEDTFDEANMIGTIAGWKRESSYWRAVEAIRFSFIERMACEVDRSVAYVLSKTGEIGDDYSSADLDIFLKKKIKKRYPLATIQENRAFNSLHKINNFLKHNTVSSYKKLAKYCSGFAVIDEKRPYETGMYVLPCSALSRYINLQRFYNHIA